MRGRNDPAVLKATNLNSEMLMSPNREGFKDDDMVS